MKMVSLVSISLFFFSAYLYASDERFLHEFYCNYQDVQAKRISIGFPDESSRATITHFKWIDHEWNQVRQFKQEVQVSWKIYKNIPVITGVSFKRQNGDEVSLNISEEYKEMITAEGVVRFVDATKNSQRTYKASYCSYIRYNPKPGLGGSN